MLSNNEMMAHLNKLKVQHLELDKRIFDLSNNSIVNSIDVLTLKKEKLLLKDQILQIEKEIIPDIIA